MSALEQIAFDAAIAALTKLEPAIASAVSNLVTAALNPAKPPLTPLLKHLEALADAKALGLNPAKV